MSRFLSVPNIQILILIIKFKIGLHSKMSIKEDGSKGDQFPPFFHYKMNLKDQKRDRIYDKCLSL